MNADELRERALSDIKKRAEHWRELLKRTRERLALYERDKSVSHALYRIYTREDRQGPQGIERPFMKAEAKIIEEFVLRRMGGTRFRSGKSETIAPRCFVRHLSDHRHYWRYRCVPVRFRCCLGRGANNQ